MTARQKLAVSISIVGIALAVAVPFATERQHWPFLFYAMYSRTFTLEDPLHEFQIHGVPLDPARGEFLLGVAHLHPFRASRLKSVLNGIVARYRTEPARIQTAAGALSDHYEARRVAGLHDGPELRAVKIYLLAWELDVLARNVNEPGLKRLVSTFERGSL